MKKLIASLMLASAVAVPTAAKADENRLNFWPVIGYDDDAFDVIWPIGHFKSAGEWWFFPIIEDNGLFCVFPEFWFGQNEFAILPFASKYDFSAGTLFPVWWWGFEKDDTFHTLFPTYYYHGYGKNTTFWAGFGLAGYKSNDKTSTHWLAPVYLKSKDLFLSIPYSRINREPSHTDAFLCGLGGYKCDAAGAMTENWCLPLWIKNDHSLVTLPYSCKWGANGETMSWFSPIVLSGGWQEHTAWKERYLLGLGGRTTDEKSGFNESWCVPFYYANNQGTLVTPVYGYNKSSQWCFPLWYNDEKRLCSALWCREKNDDGSLKSWAAPLLLSGGTTEKDGSRQARILLGLGGATWGGKDGVRSSWAFPLYYEDSKGDLVTPLYGHDRNEGYHWLAPLYYMGKDAFVSLPYIRERDEQKKSTTYVIPPLLSGVTKYDDGSGLLSALLLYGHKTDAKGAMKNNYLFPLYHYNGENGDFTSVFYGRCQQGTHTNTWWATPLVGTRSGSKEGGWLFPLFNHESERTVTYDVKTRKRKGERTDSETMAICGLFCREQTADTERKTSHARTRILWKAWDREEKNGNITVDAFPCITYDSKTNGYSKTTFLWRFFRYEKDPADGSTKLNLFFFPFSW